MFFIQILRTCLYQTALAGFVVSGWLICSGPGSAVAAIWGGLTVILPGAVHGCLLAFPSTGRSAQAALTAFLIGAVLKLLLTGALFIVAIASLKFDFIPLMSAYVAGLMGYWVALGRITPARRGNLYALLSK